METNDGHTNHVSSSVAAIMVDPIANVASPLEHVTPKNMDTRISSQSLPH